MEKINNTSFPIRAGISYNYQYSLDSKNHQKKYLGLSLGSGIHLKHLRLDVALAHYIGKYNYARDAREIFPESIKGVNANLFMIRSSLSYKF